MKKQLLLILAMAVIVTVPISQASAMMGGGAGMGGGGGSYAGNYSDHMGYGQGNMGGYGGNYDNHMGYGQQRSGWNDPYYGGRQPRYVYQAPPVSVQGNSRWYSNGSYDYFRYTPSANGVYVNPPRGTYGGQFE